MELARFPSSFARQHPARHSRIPHAFYYVIMMAEH